MSTEFVQKVYAMASFTPHQQEALNYKQHISLTANAGSGKTMVLTQRFLDIVINEEIQLRNIAAITFTKKAASELYNKIARSLDEHLEAAGEQSALRNKLEDLRKQLISAHICTIHSFCADLLREFPAEAGIDPGFTPLDEYMEMELITESGYTVFKDEFFTPYIKELSRVFNGTEQLLRVLTGLIRSREQLVTPMRNLYAESQAAPIAERLVSVFTETGMQLYNIFFTQYLAGISMVLRVGSEHATKKGKEAIAAAAPAIHDLKTIESPFQQIQSAVANAALLMTKTGKVQAAVFPTALQEDYESDLQLFYDLHKLFSIISGSLDNGAQVITAPFNLAAGYTEKILLVYQAVLAMFTLKKKQRSALDFTDMLLKLRDILADNDVRHALGGRFKYIMVDEYQDTNELQYAIFMPLLDDLQQGNLFVVGDDKQSIYMFRNAEIEIFSKTTQDILHAAPSGTQLKLPDTFRMAPGLCLFINKVFERLFYNPLAIFNEVQHVETVCARQSDAPGEMGLLVGKKLETVQIAEEALVIGKILELKQRLPDLRWSDIAILCRKKSVFETYRLELPKYNIPFTISGGSGFFQSQTVYDVMNYLRFLVSPEHDAPLVGILRSPFFLLSDAELLQIRYTGTGSLYKRLHYYSALHPESSRTAFACQTLAKHIHVAEQGGISMVLQTIFDETQYMAILSARKDAAQQIANIAKLKNIARTFEQEGLRTLYDFADYLYTAGTEKGDESYAQISDAQDAVQIMSIHASKGLQFRVVFLIRAADSLAKKGMPESPVVINKEFGLLFKVPDEGDFFKERVNTPHKMLAEYIQHKKDEAEEKRLLYVALTRAEEFLYIAGTLAKDEVTEKSFMGMMQHIVKPSFSNGHFPLRGTIKKLRFADGTFTEQEEAIVFPVENIAEITLQPLPESLRKEVTFHFDMQPLPVTGLKNTISASQFAAYFACPMKYFLRYRMRYPDGMTLTQAEAKLVQPDDREIEVTTIDAGLRGSILHKLLELQAPVDETLPETVASVCNRIVGSDYRQQRPAEQEILTTYKAFVQHEDYQMLVSHPKYKTEYTILLMEKTFRLHGIIDRLVFLEGAILIVDYKSTKHPEKLDEEKLGLFKRQLLFYAYLAHRMYPAYNSVQTEIRFISSPGKKITFTFSLPDIETFGKELQAMHTAILGENFAKNSSHCPQCQFAIKHYRCIVTG